MSKKDNDTKLIPIKYYEFRDELISDRDIPKEVYETKYKDKILELDALFEMKKKEEKGSLVFTLFLLLFTLTIGVIVGHLYQENINLKWYKDEFKKMVLSNDVNADIRYSYYMDTDSTIMTYGELGESLTILSKEANKNINELAILKSQLQKIQKSFGINIIENQNDSTIYYTIEAPALDSALMLLPVYRDRIQYDQDSKTWRIQYYAVDSTYHK